MMDPIGEYGPTFVVEQLMARCEQQLTDEFNSRMTIETIRDHMMNGWRFILRTEVWGQRLAPETTTHHVTWHETRWATWRDHFKDTYRGRWWMRAWVRKFPVRYIDIPHYRTIDLTVQAYRKFPEANLRVPDDFGPVVYQVDMSTEERWHPW